MKPNVVVIVLDTLRLDGSSGLDRLLELGFTKYDDAIAQSSWTLPSHVSMMTGQLPSSHRVHETRNLHMVDLISVSKATLDSAPNLIRDLSDSGYNTYGASANPIISPESGFKFDHFFQPNFGIPGRIGELELRLWGAPFRVHDVFRGPRFLAKNRSLGTTLRFAYRHAFDKILGWTGQRQLEKGSKEIIRHATHTDFHEPYFLFVNFIEAHEPYRWGEDEAKVHAASVLGRGGGPTYWRETYQSHASLATSRAVDLVASLIKYDPLVVVTSDHGQLIGEGGRYGHGYFLDEALLRVPLFVRFPQGARVPSRKGPFVSMTEIPGMIRAVVAEDRSEFGREVAFSESLGSPNNLRRFLRKEDWSKIPAIYAHRTRVFSKDGSFVYNHNTETVEEAAPGLPEERIRHLIDLTPKGNGALERPPPSLSKEEEGVITRRLRVLGYE